MKEDMIQVKPMRSRGYLPDENNKDNDVIHWRLSSRPHVWRPPTDVYETEADIVVRVEIGGMREEDFLVSLENRTLVVRGVRADSNERRAYHQMEIPFGEFSTEIDLPAPVVATAIEAVYQNGFLRIKLPKALPHHIQVK